MRLYTSCFKILLREKKDGLLFETGSFGGFYKIRNSFSRYLADPFLVDFNGKTYLFAESASRLTGKGKLVCAEIKNKGKIGKWKNVMKKDIHLSFPNVFIEKGFLFMMPETNENNSIIIYKCINFPNRWIEETKVIDGRYVDSLKLNENTYLSYNISNAKSFTLDLIQSNKIINRVQDYSKSLRPAGKIIDLNGVKIIPTQISDNSYGQGISFKTMVFADCHIVLNEFKRLTYVDLNYYFNTKKYLGMHTYNSSLQFEVIDVKCKSFNIFGLIRKILNKLKQAVKK